MTHAPFFFWGGGPELMIYGKTVSPFSLPSEGTMVAQFVIGRETDDCGAGEGRAHL
jgi:hypothetical protein